MCPCREPLGLREDCRAAPRRSTWECHSTGIMCEALLVPIDMQDATNGATRCSHATGGQKRVQTGALPPESKGVDGRRDYELALQ